MDGVRVTRFPYQGRNCTVYYNGNYMAYMRYEHIVGISVDYNGVWIEALSVPPVYKNSTCGLCGDYDGDANDDLRMANGTSVAGNPLAGNLIGDSYVVPDAQNQNMSYVSFFLCPTVCV